MIHVDLLSLKNQFSFVGEDPTISTFDSTHVNVELTLIQILLSFSIILHYLDKHKTTNLLSNTNVSGLSHGQVFLWKVLLCLCGDGCFKLARRSVLKQDSTHLDHFLQCIICRHFFTTRKSPLSWEYLLSCFCLKSFSEHLWQTDRPKTSQSCLHPPSELIVGITTRN